MRIEINEHKLLKTLIEQNYNINFSSNPVGLTIDSRLFQKNDIYLPIVGENFDGHDFIEEISFKNPSLIISEKNIEVDAPILKVENNRETLRKIVQLWRKKLNTKIIGITGSNGKTTTKELAYHVISPSMECFKTDKNYNTVLSSPLSFLSAKQSQNVALIEMGTNQPGEIKSICEAFNPDIGLITNISNAHAENFDSLQDIANEKGNLFKILNENGIAIINGDDPFLANIETKAQKITYGFNGNFDFNGKQIDLKTIEINGKKIDLPASGFAMAQNSLAVFTLAKILGLNENDICNKISDFDLPSGRGQIIKKNRIQIIDDSYNANPSSMIAGLKRLIERKANRKIAILGDMFELGKFEGKSHIEIGKLLLESPVDIVITTGENMKYAHEILNKKQNTFWFETKNEIIEFLKNKTENGDLLYIKGSRGMQMEKIIEGLS